MNYQEGLSFIYKKLPMYHKIGSQAYKPGLQNIEILCERLGNPHKKLKCIHIAGTNGKGSTSHMMAALLQSAGYNTGLFTSPHLKNFTERIRINGEEIESNYVAAFINKHQNLIEEIKPSFFEITTAMAFDYFAMKKVDYAVIEVGLGGRLDSTNIIIPELSIITNISYDHMDLLGNTLPEIASEKAGIIKKGIPVVISETQTEIVEVFTTKANQEKAEIFFTDDINIEDLGLTNAFRIITVKVKDEEIITNVKCSLQGSYQLKNIKGIVKSFQLLKNQGLKLKIEHLIECLLKVKELTGLKGRWQILEKKPLIVCDTGHNEGGIKEIVAQIQAIPYRKLVLILGMVKEKDHDAILQKFPINAHWIFTQPSVERAISAQELALKASKMGIIGEIIPNVNDAIKKAKAISDYNDLIFVGGSTFVVADIDNL